MEPTCGWRFYTADFSIQASSEREAEGTVTFIRDPRQRKLWHKMPESLQEDEDGPPLYICASGLTFEEAFKNACIAAAKAKPIPIME